MPNRSTIITVCALLCIAFLWGYKQEELLAMLQSSPSSEQSAAPVVPAEIPANIPPGPGGVPNSAPPIPGTVPPGAVPGAFNPPPPPVRQNTLTNTLDSIRPGQVQQEQITQRNAYFEKLSQQLRDLQGGTPPQPGEAPPPPVVPPGPIEAPPPYPGSFPPDGAVSPGFPDGQNPMAPQADFDQQTIAPDDEEEDDADVEEEAVDEIDEADDEE